MPSKIIDAECEERVRMLQIENAGLREIIAMLQRHYDEMSAIAMKAHEKTNKMAMGLKPSEN